MALFNTRISEPTSRDMAVCLDNVNLLGERQGRLVESMLAVLSELVDAILEESGGDAEMVDSLLLSLPRTEERETPDSAIHSRMRKRLMTINHLLPDRMAFQSSLYARLVLYRLLEERFKRPSREAISTAIPEAALGRIAYMTGAFANEAYLRLSAHVPHARAATFHSFVDACEEVHGGLCEYVILPLENTQSGKLTAFSRLIVRYGLYAVAACDLDSSTTGGQTTRFALLKKSTDESLPKPLAATRKRAPLCLELLHTTQSPSFSDLLMAAEFCGMRLIRADTLPMQDDLIDASTRAPLICCVLSADGADLTTFHRFLTLETPENLIMGLYRLL